MHSPILYSFRAPSTKVTWGYAGQRALAVIPEAQQRWGSLGQADQALLRVVPVHIQPGNCCACRDPGLLRCDLLTISAQGRCGDSSAPKCSSCVL